MPSGNSLSRAYGPALLALAAAAVLLRLAGIGYGLPAVFNADEPHHVNLAVSFGGGSLNPGVFKYPTLWMYALFGAYGAYFSAWSGLGLLHTAREFGALFVWHPGPFYLIARCLSAALSLLGLVWVFRGGRGLLGDRGALWAAAFLAASPTLVVSAHAAKPDSLMFFLSAWAWARAAAYLQGGKPGDLLVCALACGLAASAQYTAAPLALLPAAAAWARRLKHGGPWPARLLGLSALCTAAGFFGGSPFVLLDGRSFLRDVLDQRTVVGAGRPAGLAALSNALAFAGPWAGAAALLGGAATLLAADRPRAAFLLALPALFTALLAVSPEGAWARYLLAVYPALAWTAAEFVERWFLPRRAAPRPWFNAALALCLMAPGAAGAWSFDREILLPDTRTLAAAWVEANLPAGSAVLEDQEHASPCLRMSRAQAAELLEKTRASGHPRRRYYELMLLSHPGGGYAVFRILRDASDLRSGRWHSAWSAGGRAMLDVREGMSAAREAGVRYAILSSAGATPERSPGLGRFFSEIQARGRLLAEFRPEKGRRTGPEIRIFDVGRPP